MSNRAGSKRFQKISPVISLSKEDWAEIYYALQCKKEGIEKGEYSGGVMDSGDEQWAAQLKAIMEKIGPEGINMYLQKVLIEWLLNGAGSDLSRRAALAWLF